MSGNKVHPTNPFTRFEQHEIEQSVAARFAHIVERHPDRPAVRDKGGQLTYSELDRAANRVARAILTDTPPSLDIGEATDKGSINQRMVLKQRAALVDELYADQLSPRVLAAGER